MLSYFYKAIKYKTWKSSVKNDILSNIAKHTNFTIPFTDVLIGLGYRSLWSKASVNLKIKNQIWEPEIKI